MMTRVEQLNQTIEKLRLAHDAWLDDRNAGAAPNDRLCDAIEKTNEIFQAGVCPPSHITLNNAVAGLYAKYMEWQHGDVDVPKEAFWGALRQVFDAVQHIVKNCIPPEQIAPVSLLRKQGCTDKQIAFYIYGYPSRDGLNYDKDGDRRVGPFVKSSGGIDIDLLEKEAAEPGSIVARDWINPQDRHRMEQAGAFDLSPAIQVGPVERSQEEREAQAMQLASEGGTLAQICRVCEMHESEVVALCESKGLPSPVTNGFPSVPTSQDGLDAAIQELIDKGVKDNEIVNQLRQRGMTAANMGRVKGVRNRQPVVAK